MIRPVPLQRYLNVMQAKGFAADAVAAGAGLNLDQLQSPHYFIDSAQYLRVVDNMLALTGGEGLGLDVGLSRDVKDFGVLGYAALACSTVRQSVEEFWVHYGDTLGMMATVAVPSSNDDVVALGIQASSLSPRVYRFAVEEALCLLMKVGGQVCGVEPRFIGLQFSYPAPAYAARYREIFACPVAFDAPCTQALLPRSWFERPMEASNPELIQLYKRHLLQLRREIDASSPLVSRLQELFARRRGLLPALDEAARQLGLTPRTLQRQLRAQGRTYRKVLLDYRRRVVVECLGTGPALAKQLSDRAGFEDVNAFRRAFKTWTGKTVREFGAEVTSSPD